MQGVDEHRNGKETKAKLEELRLELGAMQRKAFERRVPLVIILEGMDVWGMARYVNHIARGLDPRGFDLDLTPSPSQNERQKPFISRFFEMMPSRGRIAIFDRSWYFWLVHECYRGGDRKRLQRCLRGVHMLERQHALEGWVILKFYLDLKKKELKRRCQEHDPKDPCRGEFHPIGEEFVKDYDEVVDLWKDVLRETDTPYAPWHWVWKEDENEAMVDMLQRIKEAVDPLLTRAPLPHRLEQEYGPQPLPSTLNVLDQVNMGRTIPVERYKEILPKLQTRLGQLQCELYKRKLPVVMVLEGWDAAGKGGNILRLTAPLNPRGYRVVPIAAPSDEEKARHHLWRFYKGFPRDGHITIFDRSWYGRVLVERVEGLTSSKEWGWAFDEINEMERMLTDHGTVLIKLWLHIDREEQMRRFQHREEDQRKRWKITAEDYRNREKWSSYLPAVEEMFARTSTKEAPWVVVPSNDKRFARLFVLQRTIEAMEMGLEEEAKPWPEWLGEVGAQGQEVRARSA